MILHEEVLGEATTRVFEALGAQPRLASFYLAGGTALALQLGHRTSLDLDLFSERPWTWETLRTALSAVGELDVDRQEEGTFVGRVGGVRVSVFRYPYLLVEPVVQTRFGIPLAGALDIAAMKLVAVAQRGSRKDFIDLYYLGEAGVSVPEALDALSRQAPGTRYNPLHVARSLAYFEDAEQEPDPVMLAGYDWDAVKRYCVDQARSLERGIRRDA